MNSTKFPTALPSPKTAGAGKSFLLSLIKAPVRCRGLNTTRPAMNPMIEMDGLRKKNNGFEFGSIKL